jgi:hypothetical protein
MVVLKLSKESDRRGGVLKRRRGRRAALGADLVYGGQWATFVPASTCANVVQSVADRVVQPQPGVPEALNWTQQLYVVGQEASGPPAPCAHAQVMLAVSS